MSAVIKEVAILLLAAFYFKIYFTIERLCIFK